MGLDSSIEAVLRLAFRTDDEPLPQAFVDLLAQLAERVPGSASIGALGDARFKAMLTEAIPRLRAFGRKLAGDAEAGDDLAQDAVLKAWAARSRFQPGTNFQAWTYTILRNAHLSKVRRKKFTGEWNDAVAEIRLSTAADQDRNINVQDVQRALDKLPPAQREALMLIGVQGLTYEQIAEMHDVPLGTVKSRVNRGRIALARLIDGEDEDEDVAA
jgi:RNA polymerase sigma-70 factor (ECF subfamily)